MRGKHRTVSGPLHLALIVGLAILAIAQLVMLGVRARAIGPAMAFLTSGDDVSEVSFHLGDATVARLGDGRRTLLLVFDPDCPHTRRVAPAWSEWLSAVDTGGPQILGIAPGPRAPAETYAREMEWDVPVAALVGVDDDTMEMIVGRVPWVIAIDERGHRRERRPRQQAFRGGWSAISTWRPASRGVALTRPSRGAGGPNCTLRVTELSVSFDRASPSTNDHGGERGMAARRRKVPEAEFRAIHQKWREGFLTQEEAAARLGLSERTFRKYASGMRTQGSQWWEPRPRHLPPSRRAPDDERQALQGLYSEHYSGWSVRHFYEKYRVEHGGERSYTWVKDLLQVAGLVERRVRNGTTKRGAGKEQWRSTERSPREGMLLHQIASRREWTPGRTWDLMLTVDDATNRLYSGFFVEEREIWAVFRAIRESLEKNRFDSLSLGLALGDMLTARDTRFGGRTRMQVERAMSELDIHLVRPDGRMRMRSARMFGTLFGRLPQELAAEGISDTDRANRWLSRVWPRVNEWFAYGANRGAPTGLVGLKPLLQAKLRDVLCLKQLGSVLVWPHGALLGQETQRAGGRLRASENR